MLYFAVCILQDTRGTPRVAHTDAPPTAFFSLIKNFHREPHHDVGLKVRAIDRAMVSGTI